MTRRNKKSRGINRPIVEKDAPITQEEQQQKRSVLIWTIVITIALVALFYYLLFRS